MPTKEEFIELLSETSSILKKEAVLNRFKSSTSFENRVREVISDLILLKDIDLEVDFNSHAQAFPDICLGEFGVEVKFTEKDTFKGVANSISQGMKDPNVKEIFILWGKMGGEPEVVFKRYEDAVCHVRTSHVPRFEIDMQSDSSLFELLKMSYAEFSTLNMETKMDLVRAYVRNRLRNGSKTFYWYLESQLVDSEKNSNLVFFKDLELQDKKIYVATELALYPDLLKDKDSKHFLDERIRFFLNRFSILYPAENTLLSYLIKENDNFEGYDALVAELKAEIPEALSKIELSLIKSFWHWSSQDDYDCNSLIEIWNKRVE
ncbi:hypothetical protein OAD37_03730 [Gammaproteobacteria bacterium]|nr:hypothetical protein [Gammaproteobacteria bacterium]